MRLVLALGVALAATTVAAEAQNRVFIRHAGGGHMADIDTNHDGWITRQEASAGADRMFADLDTNHDGKLDDSDRQARVHEFEMRMPGGGPGDADGPLGAGCTRTIDPPNATAGQDRRVTIVCDNDGRTEQRVFVTRGDDNDDDADAHAEHGGDRQVERQVIIRGPEGGPPGVPGVPAVPPVPPMPPHPPMFMMFMSNSDEFDRNHDGALSREEFRAQQLRFFDAMDGNGDGRVRFEPPPEPPQPPAPPEPPQPPR